MAGYSINAKFIGGDALKARLLQSSQIVKNEVANALNKAAIDVEAEAKKKAPHQTGRLWGSLHVGNPGSVSQMATPDNLKAVVGTNLKYARYQEEGTGLYGPQGTMIIPKNAKAMIMTDKSGNVTAWFKSSKGVHPKWYLKQAFQTVKPKMTEYMRIAMQRVVSQLAGK